MSPTVAVIVSSACTFTPVGAGTTSPVAILTPSSAACLFARENRHFKSKINLTLESVREPPRRWTWSSLVLNTHRITLALQTVRLVTRATTAVLAIQLLPVSRLKLLLVLLLRKPLIMMV